MSGLDLFWDQFGELVDRCLQNDADASAAALERNRLPDDWHPGCPCPETGEPCDRMRCFDAESCDTYKTSTSEDAAACGELLAKLAESVPIDEFPERCLSCAFRKGTRANRTDDVMVSIDIALSGKRVFNCHAPSGDICAGYLMALQALGRTPPSGPRGGASE